MLVVLFSLLGCLYFLESTTSIARCAGVRAGNIANGLQIQASLALFSRAINSLFLPLLGYLADKNAYSGLTVFELILLASIITLFLVLTLFIRNNVICLYEGISCGISRYGKLWPIWEKNNNLFSLKLWNGGYIKKKMMWIRLLTFISYIPYYLSWPVCILLLGIFYESRAFIVSITSVLNGINTIILVMVVDPKLIQLSRYKRISESIFVDQLFLRFFASVTSLFILFVISYFLK